MASLKDIARECGCDISTVSRALQDSPRVKPTTKEKVKKAADKLGYKPNIIAQALARGKTNVIAYLVPSLVSETENLPALHMSQYLLEKNYDLIICQYHENHDLIKRQLNRIETGGADAVIISAAEYSFETFGSLLKSFKIPFLFLDRHCPGTKALTVTSENYKTSRELTKKLVDSKVDGILHFFTRDNTVSKERKKGLLEAAGNLPVIDFEENLVEFIQKNKIQRLGVCASVQESVYKYLDKTSINLDDIELFASAYDHWNGETAPFQKVYFAEQNWPEIAKKATDSILGLVDKNKPKEKLAQIPFLPIKEK